MSKPKINIVAILHVLDDRMVVEISFNPKLTPRNKFVLGLLVDDASKNAGTLAASDLIPKRQIQILAMVDKIGQLEFVDASKPVTFVDANVFVTLASAYIESGSDFDDMVQQIANAIVNILDPNCKKSDIGLSVSPSTALARELAVQEFGQIFGEEAKSSPQGDGENDDAATDE